jgi:hypothetical protein
MPVSPEAVGVVRVGSFDDPVEADEPDCAVATDATASMMHAASDVMAVLRMRDTPVLPD